MDIFNPESMRHALTTLADGALLAGMLALAIGLVVTVATKVGV